MVAIPTKEDIGYSVRVHWAADQGDARNLSSVNWFVVHDTEGYMSNDEPYLAAPTDPQASCHALIAPSGELVFMVPLSITAWTPGNDAVANRSINVEMSGFQSKGYTADQYKSMAAFFRWCVKQGCNIPAEYAGKTGRVGIIGHQDVPNPYWPNAANQWGGKSGHTDPGPLFNWERFIAMCKGVDPVKPYEPNPQGFDVGPGALAKATEWGLTIISNEQYFVPDPAKPQPGLGKMSRTYVRDANMRTFVIMASEQPELTQPGKDTPWKVEQFAFIR
jgi:hypothetical protein